MTVDSHLFLCPQVVFLDSLGPSDVAGWKAEGGRHFGANQYEEAGKCYGQALKLLLAGGPLTSDSAGGASSSSGGRSRSRGASASNGGKAKAGGSGLLLDSLLNASAAALQCGTPAAALRYATTALAVSDGKASKAYFRAATALDATPGRQTAARSLMTQAVKAGEGLSKEAAASMMAQLKEPHGGLLDAPAAQAALLQALESGSGGVDSDSAAAASAAAAAAGPSAAGEEPAAAMAAAAAAKERGNALFRSGQFKEALSEYLAAIGALRALPAALLLSNRAMCHLRLGGEGNLQSALLDAAAAVTLDPTYGKGHHRRIAALLQLGWLDAARAALRAGKAQVGDGTASGLRASSCCAGRNDRNVTAHGKWLLC